MLLSLFYVSELTWFLRINVLFKLLLESDKLVLISLATLFYYWNFSQKYCIKVKCNAILSQSKSQKL